MLTDVELTQSILRVLSAKTRVGNGFQKLTITGASAQSLTIPEGTVCADIQVESATTTGFVIRYLFEGNTTLPTTTNGIGLAHATVFDIPNGTLLSDFRAIAISGTHTLNIQYYK